MILGVLAVVVFFISHAAGSAEKYEPSMMAAAEVEPSVEMTGVGAPIDFDEGSFDSDGDGVSPKVKDMVHQAQVQQVQIQEQKQLTDDLLDEVNALRGALIEKRFKSLDQKARRRGWHRNRRIPKEGSRHWDEYQEWMFLKENREEVKKPKLKKRPKAAAKPIQASQKHYKPDWLME